VVSTVIGLFMSLLVTSGVKASETVPGVIKGTSL